MTIGLTVKQIRKLAKRAYSDKQIAAQGEVRTSGKWWHNGIVSLFEPLPENVSVEKCPASRTVAYAKILGEMIAKCRYEVYPVEVQPWLDKRKLVFESNCADRVAVDARYVASILATKRVGKKRDPGVRWYTDFQGEMLYAENGRRLGIVWGLHEFPGDDPEWNFRYTGELPN